LNALDTPVSIGAAASAVIDQAGLTVGDFQLRPKSLLRVFIVPTDGTGAAN
jgi:hypothetical protein